MTRRRRPRSIAVVRRTTRALRPLRIATLRGRGRASASRSAASTRRRGMFVNLVTGASLPDEGRVRVFGTSHRRRSPTATSGSPRSTLRHRQPARRAARRRRRSQNLAMPFTLEIDPVPPRRLRRRSRRWRTSAGIAPACLDVPRRRAARGVRARASTSRARSRSSRSCCCWSIRPPALPKPDARARSARRRAREPERVALTRCGHHRWTRSSPRRSRTRTLALQPATGALVAVEEEARMVPVSRYFFITTPQATRGPPLTPDFGSPVMPWSGLP